MNSNDEIGLVNCDYDPNPDTIDSHDEPWPTPGVEIDWTAVRQHLLNLFGADVDQSHAVLGVASEPHSLERLWRPGLAPGP